MVTDNPQVPIFLEYSSISVFTTINWMKPAWHAEPMLLTSILLAGALLATPAESASNTSQNVTTKLYLK